MGGYGVINLKRLEKEKERFYFFANHLAYPETSPFTDERVIDYFSASHPAYDDISHYWDLMHEKSLDELQSTYTDIFDFQKDATLFMTYVKYEDSKERGQMLARLKVFYEMFGLTMSDGELSDLLPLMCEFIYAAEWTNDARAEQGFKLLFAVIEDGSYHLLKALEKYESPYYYLVKALRETCRACVVQKEVLAND